jgi:Cupin-like domain
MLISVLHQHYKMQRRSACEERTMIFILTALIGLCLMNSLVLLGRQPHGGGGDGHSFHEFSIGRYHVDGDWKPNPNRNGPNHHQAFVPDRQHNLFRSKKKGKKHMQQQEGVKPKIGNDDNDETKRISRLRSHWESTNAYQTEPEERAKYPVVASLPYNVRDCPKTQPPVNYPIAFAAQTILAHWNVDELRVPNDYHYGSLCVFDWTIDYEAIQVYRQHEVPFVVIHHPEIDKTVQRWKSDEYLTALIGDGVPQRTEYSHNNHLMYWKSHGHHDPADFVPPTEDLPMTFTEWKINADQIANVTNARDKPHWYLRYNAAKPDLHAELYTELPFFDTDAEATADFIVDKQQERGINCRFGMAGGIAEAHFDPTRNWLVHLGGTGPRRYILAHPNQCSNMMLYPQNHPSGRHASINWSSEYTTEPFASAQLLETVLQVSDALYLPTSWLHFIVALGTNYQCNARSGTTTENHPIIQECGFSVPAMIL